MLDNYLLFAILSPASSLSCSIILVYHPASYQLFICEVCSLVPQLMWNSQSDVLALVGARPLIPYSKGEARFSKHWAETKVEQHKTSGVSFFN